MTRARRLIYLLSAAVASLALTLSVASAANTPDGGIVDDGARDTHQHGDNEGHLYPQGTSANVQLVSNLKLKNVVPEKIADVGV